MPHETDVCILGAGQCGGVVAQELASKGLAVSVLEAGPRYRPELDFINDEAEMMKLFWNDPRILDGKHPVMANSGKGVGGSGLVWTAVSFRFHGSDFRTYTTDGVGRDWPFTHDDLKPYYEKVEHGLGIAGLSRAGCDNLSPRYPMPPHPANTVGLLFERGCQALGLEAVPGSMAINSTAYDGRDTCVYCGFCMQGCAIDAKASSLNTYVPKAEKFGAKVLPQCTAYQIVVDKDGRAERVLYYDPQGNKQEAAARVIVVAASAVETPRLLLESACEQFPNGLANRSGLVGKNFMGHVLQFVWGKFADPIDGYRGFNLGHRCYIDEYPTRPGRDYARGFVLESYMAPPMSFVMSAGSEWGAEMKEFIDHYRHYAGIFAVGESLPNDANSVTLDQNTRDQNGRACPRVTHEWQENDINLIAGAARRSEEILRAAGATEVFTSTLRGAHYMGTCRLGVSPEDSVVNQYGQCHDVPNLFICDSSVFVTGGSANISLTAMAIVQRGAEWLAEQLRAGEL